MKRLKENAAEAKPTSYELFDGDVKVQDMVLPANGSSLLMHSVTFDDGARTKWHTHGSDQVIIVTDGTGVAANRDEEWEIKPGDVVVFGPGEEHWHGARDGESMTHLVFMTSRDIGILDS